MFVHDRAICFLFDANVISSRRMKPTSTTGLSVPMAKPPTATLVAAVPTAAIATAAAVTAPVATIDSSPTTTALEAFEQAMVAAQTAMIQLHCRCSSSTEPTLAQLNSIISDRLTQLGSDLKLQLQVQTHLPKTLFAMKCGHALRILKSERLHCGVDRFLLARYNMRTGTLITDSVVYISFHDNHCFGITVRAGPMSFSDKRSHLHVMIDPWHRRDYVWYNLFSPNDHTHQQHDPQAFASLRDCLHIPKTVSNWRLLIGVRRFLICCFGFF